jgi:hypothetical protein
MEKFMAKSFNQLAKSAYGNQWDGVENYVQKLSQPLAKALATAPVAGQAFADGTAMVLQNLDSIMTSVLFTEEQLVKQRFIDRVPSINPIYQWNRRNSYGTNRGALGFAEGGIGPVGNASWSRNQETVRFFGIQRGTTIVANIAGALGGMFDNPVEEEEYDGTMQLLSSVERSLVWGNSTVTDGAGNPIFYDGFYRKLRYSQNGAYANSNIIDLRGNPLTFDIFSEIAALAQKQFVTNTRNMAAFLDPDTLQTLQLQKNLAERRMMGTSPSDGGFVAGTPLKGYDTQLGFIPFVPDVFLEPVQGKTPLVTADYGAPAKPASVTVAVAAPIAGQTSKFANSDAGTIYYSVAAFNAAGESLALVTAGAAVTAGSIATITIPNVAGAFGYRIYRGVISSGSDAQWIGEVANVGGANTTFADDNFIMPGTNVGLIIEKSQQNVVMPQMAPLLKLPLAIQNTTIPFGLLYLHTLAVKAPERQFLIINIGKTGYTL